MDWKEVNFDPKYSFHNRLSFTGRGIHKNDVFLATVDVVVDKAAGDDVDNLQYDHATGNKFLKFFVNLRMQRDNLSHSIADNLHPQTPLKSPAQVVHFIENAIYGFYNGHDNDNGGDDDRNPPSPLPPPGGVGKQIQRTHLMSV
jgi:hypothetical protein